MIDPSDLESTTTDTYTRGSRAGSFASFLPRTPDVRLSPDSGEIADIPQPPLGAMNGPRQLGRCTTSFGAASNGQGVAN